MAKWLKLLLLGLGVVLLYLLLRPQHGILITTTNQQCHIAVSYFELEWQHSVELQQWREHYIVYSDHFLLDKTYLQAFGAGTPSEGQLISAPAGYVGFAKAVKLKEINWAVSPNMQGKIHSTLGTWLVAQTVAPYSNVRLAPLTQPLLYFWLGENCHDHFK